MGSGTVLSSVAVPRPMDAKAPRAIMKRHVSYRAKRGGSKAELQNVELRDINLAWISGGISWQDADFTHAELPRAKL